MNRILAFLISILVSTQTAQAEDAVALDIGQVVMVRVDAAGAFAVAESGVAELSDFDRGAVQALTGLPLEVASGPNAAVFSSRDIGQPKPQAIAPGAIRVLFARLANGESLLVLENGYDQALAYRARISRAGRAEATDVCTVLPNLRSYEHWPYRIDRVELSALRLEPWPEGQRPRCE